MTRRSWRRQLDSSSSDSPSPPSLSATAILDHRRPAVPPAAPGPSGLSHCVDLDLFHGDNISPLTKTTPCKGMQCQREGQTPGFSNSVKASTDVKATRTNGNVGSPLTKTTPRKGIQRQRESQTPAMTRSVKSEARAMRTNGDFRSSGTPRKGTHNDGASQTLGITNFVKATRCVVKATGFDGSYLMKTTPRKGLPSERKSQTPGTSSSGTKAASSTEVRASITEAKTKNSGTSSCSKQLKLKTIGASYITKSSAPPGAKLKTPTTKQNPLPDTPRPKREKDQASFCRALLRPGRCCTTSARELQSTSSSSSSLRHPETQRKTPVKKKDKSSASCSHKKPSALRADYVKNHKLKKPNPSSGNDDSKSLIVESKCSSETSIEGQVTQASDEKGPKVEQTQLVANAVKAQASDRPSTSSAQQEEPSSGAGGAPEPKKEPWSKKKYLLEKSAMDMSEQSPSHNASRGTMLPGADSASGSSGDATVNQTQSSPFLAADPLTLSESTIPAPVSLLNQEATNPGPSSASKPECCFLKLSPLEPKSCSSKPPDCFLKPDPPGPKSCISCKNHAGVFTTTTTTTTSSNSISSSSNSSVAEFRRDCAEIPGSQASVETSVTLLGAPSKEAPQGCASGHDYAAPLSSASRREAAASQDSAVQGASDGHQGQPPEGLSNQGANERERDGEGDTGGNALNFPGARMHVFKRDVYAIWCWHMCV